CSLALAAKAQGYHVLASDVAERALIPARALVANPAVRLRREDLAALLRDVAREPDRLSASPLQAVLPRDDARFLMRAFTVTERRSEPVRSLLALTLLKATLRLFPLSLPSATDAPAAAAGDFDRVSPRRVGHYLRRGRVLTP